MMVGGGQCTISVVGLVSSVEYHMARCCVEDIDRDNPDTFTVEKRPLLEFEWNSFREQRTRELGGDMWAFEEPVLVCVDGEVLGSHKDFIAWAHREYNFEDFRPLALYSTLTEDAYQEELIARCHNYVFMEISSGEDSLGRLMIELYTDVVPKTCENFRALCTGEHGIVKHNEVEQYNLHYKNTVFHRVLRGGWVQGGDIWYGRGNGGESIYGETFEDENFAISHDARGVVSMANRGRHSNGSQFFLTLKPSHWMDTKYVAFGRIVEGTETLNAMEAVESANERPLLELRITDCGQVHPGVNTSTD